jgi:hypothetical protein
MKHEHAPVLSHASVPWHAAGLKGVRSGYGLMSDPT